MKATIWHNPRCGTSRRTLEILQSDPGVVLMIIEYLKTPPSREQLGLLYKRAGLTPRQGLRAKEPLARDLDLDLGDAAVLDAMSADPILIERPIVETEKGVRLCRPPERVREILWRRPRWQSTARRVIEAPMAIIAVYSMKGGVGKTTLALNLAWCAARLSARRTLLWDLDGQAAASWLLRDGKPPKREAEALYDQSARPSKLIKSTRIERLDLMPADASLRALDRLFFSVGKKKRLARLIEAVARDYDRILLDCPPGLTETSEQIIRAADIILVPVIPSLLSRRAFEEVAAHIERHHPKAPAILPVHTMVDRRRKLHREAIARDPAWPAIPMASIVETATAQRNAVGEIAAASAAAQAFASLWRVMERRIAERTG